MTETFIYRMSRSLIGAVGFLPTISHEVAHVPRQANHNPLYQPWIKRGHDYLKKKKLAENSLSGYKPNSASKELVEIIVF